MKQANFRAKRKRGALTNALIANFLNIVIIAIFKLIINLIGPGNYNIPFGIIQLVLISAFWIGFNYYQFKDAGEEDTKDYVFYLLMCMAPMLFFTLIAIIFSSINIGTSFGSTWNALTFAVAPALYLCIPYGIFYRLIGMNIPMAVFMLICIVYICAVQFIGYLIGKKSRQEAIARVRKRQEIQERKIAEQAEMAERAKQQRETEASRIVRQGVRKRTNPKPNRRDPLSDIEQPAVIQTEAFEPITDEMIAKVKTEQEAKKEARRKASEARKAKIKRMTASPISRQKSETQKKPPQTTSEKNDTDAQKEQEQRPKWIIPGKGGKNNS